MRSNRVFPLLMVWLAGSCVAEPLHRVLPGETPNIADRPAFIWLPAEELRRTPQPWVMYAPTLAPYPDEHERWMHEKFLAAGVAVAGIDCGEAYGSPRGTELMSALYDELVEERSFASKPCLLGRSRGGLWVSAWAITNPRKAAGIAGIYPVFDLRSYPGLDKAAGAYGLTAEELEDGLAEHNPIERVGVLAEANIPVFIIHGDADHLVPLEPNSGRLVEKYRAAGAGDSARLTTAAGQGHSAWSGYFRCEPLIQFVIDHAKAGAEADASR